MAGRKRKPEALVAIEGRRKHLTKAQIADRQGPGWRRAGLPDPPEHMGEAAVELWRRIGPEIDEKGLLTAMSLPAFEALCSAYGEMVEASHTINAEGLIVETEHGTRAHPGTKIRADAQRRFLSYCGEFGLTPATEGKAGRARTQAIDPIAAALA